MEDRVEWANNALKSAWGRWQRSMRSDLKEAFLSTAQKNMDYYEKVRPTRLPAPQPTSPTPTLHPPPTPPPPHTHSPSPTLHLTHTHPPPHPHSTSPTAHPTHTPLHPHSTPPPPLSTSLPY